MWVKARPRKTVCGMLGVAVVSSLSAEEVSLLLVVSVSQEQLAQSWSEALAQNQWAALGQTNSIPRDQRGMTSPDSPLYQFLLPSSSAWACLQRRDLPVVVPHQHSVRPERNHDHCYFSLDCPALGGPNHPVASVLRQGRESGVHLPLEDLMRRMCHLPPGGLICRSLRFSSAPFPW
jgi:hypothetical protein